MFGGAKKPCAEGFALVSRSSKKLSCLPSCLAETVRSLNLVAKSLLRYVFSFLFQIILHIHHMNMSNFHQTIANQEMFIGYTNDSLG